MDPREREVGGVGRPVPSRSAIEIQWSATWDVMAGRAISAIALLALAGVALGESRKRQV